MRAVGIVSAITDSGFVMETKNRKTKVSSSLDVKIDSGTVFSKNGLVASTNDLSVGQKVIVLGSFDKTTNTLTARRIKIA